MLRAALVATLFFAVVCGSLSMPTVAGPDPGPVLVVRGNLTVQQILLGNGAALRGDGNLHVDGVLRLVNATGTLTVDGVPLVLRAQSVEIIDANLSLLISASNIIPPIDGVVMVELPSLRLDGTASRVLIDGRDVGAQERGASRFKVAVPAPWLAGGAVALLGFAATGAVVVRSRHRDHFGLDAWIRGDPESALARAENHLAKRPTERDATVIKGAALFRLGRTDEALAFLRARTGEVKDPNGLLATLRCAGLLNAGRPDEAGRELQEALRSNPHLAHAIEGTELEALLGARDQKRRKEEAPTGYA